MSGAIMEPPPRPVARSRDRVLTLLGLAALVAASIGLFIVSRGKWSDAIIDSGREWIVPDALVRGDLLYRDVVYWFGPFTPYFHAAFFKLFGSSFTTLVVAGVVGSIGVLGALYFALRSVTAKYEAALWTALAIPALVFMPRAGGAILGMGYRMWNAATFTLLAITLVCGRRTFRHPALGIAVGTLCALAGLCRTEWGLAATAAAVLVVGVRGGVDRVFWPAFWISGIFAVLFSAGIAIFVRLAGAEAVLKEGHVLLTGLPKETMTFLHRFSWGRDLQGGVLQLLYSSSLLLTGFLLVEAWASKRDDPQRLVRRLPWIAGANLFIALYSARGGASSRVLFSAAPVLCAVAAFFGIRSMRGKRAAALAGFGSLGLVLSFRKPLDIGDSPYVGPPLLFAFLCGACLMEEVIDREQSRAIRGRLRRAYLTVLGLALCFAFLGRGRQYLVDRLVPVPGTGGMLSASPGDAQMILRLARAISNFGSDGGLVVFPEGELLNYLTGRRNPLRHKLYIPGYLSDETEPAVLRELSTARPEAVVILRRFAGEYGPAYFGFHYGRRVRQWIEANYVARPYDSEWNGVCEMRSAACLFVLRR